jgi:GTPase
MPNLTKIAATIHVEKTGQRAILIGANGEMLKRIGTDARLEIEQLTGKKVFLSLFVKVKPNWREDPAFLNAIDWRAMVGSK